MEVEEEVEVKTDREQRPRFGPRSGDVSGAGDAPFTCGASHHR